jgi:hypothetical protein
VIGLLEPRGRFGRKAAAVELPFALHELFRGGWIAPTLSPRRKPYTRLSQTRFIEPAASLWSRLDSELRTGNDPFSRTNTLGRLGLSKLSASEISCPNQITVK